MGSVGRVGTQARAATVPGFTFWVLAFVFWAVLMQPPSVVSWEYVTVLPFKGADSQGDDLRFVYYHVHKVTRKGNVGCAILVIVVVF